MDLSQEGGDVSLGPLIICCYSQALVIIDKHPVSLRYSSNQVLLRPGRSSGTKESKEKKGTCAYPDMIAHCIPHFEDLQFQHHLTTSFLFICHDCRHPNYSGTRSITSPKTPSLFLGIYLKEIIEQVPERYMYKVVCCCVPYRSRD